MLTNEQLLLNYHQTKSIEIRNMILNNNIKLVHFFAIKFKSKSNFITTDDLISEGTIGLISSIEKYDPAKNVKFSYYASFWIKKCITDFILNNNSTIKNPYHKQLKAGQIHKDVARLIQVNHYDIFPEDILTLGKYSMGDINFYFDDSSQDFLLEFNDVDKYDNTDEEIDELTKSIIKNSIKHLSPIEQKIINKYFGFDTQPMTLQLIANELNCSKMRVCNIKNKALAKLKSKLF